MPNKFLTVNQDKITVREFKWKQIKLPKPITRLLTITNQIEQVTKGLSNQINGTKCNYWFPSKYKAYLKRFLLI